MCPSSHPPAFAQNPFPRYQPAFTPSSMAALLSACVRSLTRIRQRVPDVFGAVGGDLDRAFAGEADGDVAVVDGPGSPGHACLAHGGGEVVGLLEADVEAVELDVVVARQRHQLGVVDRLLPEGAEGQVVVLGAVVACPPDTRLQLLEDQDPVAGELRPGALERR